MVFFLKPSESRAILFLNGTLCAGANQISAGVTHKRHNQSDDNNDHSVPFSALERTFSAIGKRGRILRHSDLFQL